jgi:hypothetical protein
MRDHGPRRRILRGYEGRIHAPLLDWFDDVRSTERSDIFRIPYSDRIVEGRTSL